MSTAVTYLDPAPVSVVAGIVTYNPDLDELEELVSRVAAEAEKVVIFANSPIEIQAVTRLREAAAGRLILNEPGGNRGLGEAYDALLGTASAHGAEFLLLLDQDSTPTLQMISRLVDAHRHLAARGERPALVGPQPVDESGKPMRIPVRQGSPAPASVPGTVRVEFAISSGSLLGVEVARAVGGFRRDFFIDAIDLEWCMRANHRGYSVWVARDVVMSHRLGRGIIRVPGGLLLTDQPPRRLYTYLRNQLAMMRLPHVPVRHKAKTALSFPLRIATYLAHNRFSAESRAAVLNGILDGIRNRLGPPDRATQSPFRRR
jgi:rhamnosyltransferase